MFPTWSILSYSLFVPMSVLPSSMYFELCQFSDFHSGNCFKFKMATMSVIIGTKFNMKLYFLSQRIWVPAVMLLS